MTVLLTGLDGYVGWPTALRIGERTDGQVVGVDNGARRRWVEEVDPSLAIAYLADEDPGPSHHVNFDRLAEPGFEPEYTLREVNA